MPQSHEYFPFHVVCLKRFKQPKNWMGDVLKTMQNILHYFVTFVNCLMTFLNNLYDTFIVLSDLNV